MARIYLPPVFLSLLFAFSAAPRVKAANTTASHPAAKPNIVFIVADDMGYSLKPWAAYGGEIQTPHPR